ncbi:MAG: A/G-specific adenine glycosylase [Oscillospiraceae bacterium]|nr:A/G-specific adenine glycosylase [Oscillospiraceae bacterium]
MFCKAPLQQLPIPLLQWYREHARILPWRSQPTPYRVWISEIMLQQTRVSAVLPYFHRFLQAFPTIAHLAAASDDHLMKLWEGLGYYSRARNLKKAANQIMEQFGGIFPSSYEEILTLAGIGEYTAGAIASIAFGIPVPAVDGNVLRVVARITGFADPIDSPKTRRLLRAAVWEIIPLHAPGDFNQALMELGATVCLPNGAPLCSQCPVASFCRAFLQSRTEELPVKSPRKPRRVEMRTVFLLFFDGSVALRRRPEKGLLSGLWEFPNVPGSGDQALAEWEISPAQQWEACNGKHVFTHVEWHMTGQAFLLANDILPEGWVWANRAKLQQTYAVPSAFASFLPLVETYCAVSAPLSANRP